jgi:hypothetical protein
VPKIEELALLVEFSVPFCRSWIQRHRVAFLIGVTLFLGASPFLWYFLATFQLVDWPSGSTDSGLLFGIVAAVIILFEMLLWVRKNYRRFRRLGTVQRWMALHIWLGFISLPLAILHCGFGLGGSLSATVMILFLLVIASGVWGLIMQQVIPSRLISDISLETVAPEIDFLVGQYLNEAHHLVDEVSIDWNQVERTDRLPDTPLRKFFVDELQTFFSSNWRVSPLKSRGQARQIFSELNRMIPADQHPAVRRLEELCDARRELERQRWLNRWLHNWLCIHFPLSVALMVLVVFHAVVAMKWFW